MFTVLEIPTLVLKCTMLQAQRKATQMLGYLTFWNSMLLPEVQSSQIWVNNKNNLTKPDYFFEGILTFCLLKNQTKTMIHIFGPKHFTGSQRGHLEEVKMSFKIKLLKNTPWK